MSSLATANGVLADERLRAGEFADLLRLMTDTTTRLQTTHGALTAEVGRLKAELAETNARLRRSESLAALGEMAAGIAHEVRNPLASILLDVHMLREDAETAEQRGFCDRIIRSVEGLDSVVHDVLLFAGDVSPRPVRVDTRGLIDDVLADCAASLQAGDVRVECSAAGAERLWGDPRLLRQALVNVVRNAAQALHDAEGLRVIEVSLERTRVRQAGGARSDRIAIRVADTGPGIAPHVRERMFNPFFTTRASGTGLGLAIVNRIIEGHGGEVRVGERRPRGAIVELLLPPGPTEPSARSGVSA